MKRANPIVYPLLSFGAVLVLWELLVSTGVLNAKVMPLPWTVAKTFYAFLAGGELFVHVWASLSRVLIGFAIGTLCGVVLGVLVGHFERFARFADPLIQALRPIPIAAWLPLAIIWFGIGDKPGIFLIVIGVFFPVFLNTVHGVKFTPPILVRAAQTLGATGRTMLLYVILPSALPNILTGARIGLGLAWVCVVISELLGVTAGLGFLIWDAQTYLRTDKVIVGMIIIAVMGTVCDRLLVRLSSRWIGT